MLFPIHNRRKLLLRRGCCGEVGAEDEGKVAAAIKVFLINQGCVSTRRSCHREVNVPRAATPPSLPRDVPFHFQQMRSISFCSSPSPSLKTGCVFSRAGKVLHSSLYRRLVYL